MLANLYVTTHFEPKPDLRCDLVELARQLYLKRRVPKAKQHRLSLCVGRMWLETFECNSKGGVVTET